eukprot:6173242-Pleurochrysis_carterae.AAC.2
MHDRHALERPLQHGGISGRVAAWLGTRASRWPATHVGKTPCLLWAAPAASCAIIFKTAAVYSCRMR